MQQLLNREVYGPTMAVKIEVMGATAVAVANRWQLGWPEQVRSLLNGGQYLEALSRQTNLEKDVLAEAGNLPHLAHHEILEMNEVPMAPPTAPVADGDLTNSAWWTCMLDNMTHMANNPDYRKTVAKKLF